MCVCVCVRVGVCTRVLLPWKHLHLDVTLHWPSTRSCSLIMGDHHNYDISPLLRSLPWLPAAVSAFSFPSSPSQAMPPSWEARIRSIKQGPACKVAGGPTLLCQWTSSHPPNPLESLCQSLWLCRPDTPSMNLCCIVLGLHLIVWAGTLLASYRIRLLLLLRGVPISWGTLKKKLKTLLSTKS